MNIQFNTLWNQIAKLENIQDVSGRELYMVDGIIAMHYPSENVRIITQNKTEDGTQVWAVVEKADGNIHSYRISEEDFQYIKLGVEFDAWDEKGPKRAFSSFWKESLF